MDFFRISVFSCFLLVATSAHAGFFIEPYAGYATGRTDMKVKASTDFPNGVKIGLAQTEISLGSRLGYKTSFGFWIAADPQVSLSGMAKDDTSGHSNAYSRTQVYADLGFDLGILRTYAGYAVLNELKLDNKFSGGTTLKAGLGFLVTSHLSLNVEYHINGYKEATDDSTTVSVADFYDKFEGNLLVISLSMPFGTEER